MADHETKIKINERGVITSLSLIHPIGDEFYLIEQTIDDEGNVTYYTNQVKEKLTGKINLSDIKLVLDDQE